MSVPATWIRSLLKTEPFLFGPGVYEPMTAQLVMYYGFKAVYFSGYSFAMGHLGTTDMDLYSGPEIADAARRTVLCWFRICLETRHQRAARFLVKSNRQRAIRAHEACLPVVALAECLRY